MTDTSDLPAVLDGWERASFTGRRLSDVAIPDDVRFEQSPEAGSSDGLNTGSDAFRLLLCDAAHSQPASPLVTVTP